MSAHRVLRDMWRANTQRMITDPGDAGTITPDMDLQMCEMTSSTTETRTLAAPTRSGIRFALRLYSDGGTVTVTATGGVNAAGDTTIIFADAGDIVTLISVQSGASTYRWELLTGQIYVPSVELASTSPSSSPSSSPSTSPSSSASATG